MASYILTTERLGLRRWIDSDIQPFIEMNKDAEVMKYFPATLTDNETSETIERIKLHFDKNNFGFFAVEERLSNQFIGFTGLAIPTFESFFTPCVEIGWRYRKDAWGHGFATEAANACLEHGFNSLHLEKIVSFTPLSNMRSEKVMRRIGMTYVANFEHPKVGKESPLRTHLLYEIKKTQFISS